MTLFQEQILELGQLVTRGTLQAELFRFIMYAQPYANVVQHGRNNCCLNNIKIGHAYKFSHQEGCSAHNRGHELATGGGSSFYGTGKRGTIAQLLHHRDGKGACTSNVTNGGAGYGAHQAGG